LAPLRFGAGIKGKISDGWCAGTPVVSTTIGSEGMSGHLPWGGEISNDPRDFARKAILLHQDEAIWNDRSHCAKILVQKLYSIEENSARLLEYLENLHSNLNQIRNENFIGTMLNHHLHKSTKYFSLWIETKNQLKDPKKLEQINTPESRSTLR
jgi:hypothetical protein